MSSQVQSAVRASVARQAILGVAGIGLVGFIVAHLAGNLFIFLGPEAFNAYAEKLHELGALLWVARGGLLAIFVAHVYLTARLWLGNRSARPQRYAQVRYQGDRTFATRSMIYTGALIFLFVFIHLYDFTLADKEGAKAVVNGENLGLYGVVWNGFANPLRSLFYIVVMVCLGLHLSHAVSSVVVTLGADRSAFVRRMDLAAKAAGAAIAVGFSSIPVYVLARAYFIN